MKRLITILMTLFVMGSAFAYTPKAECFKVTKNRVTYEEHFEDSYGLNRFPFTKGERLFVIRKDYPVENVVDYYWDKLQRERCSYDYATGRNWMDYRERAVIDKAVLYIPFVTEENFLTITKEEILEEMKALIDSLRYSKK